jgi:hypothetical protein
MPAFSEMPLFLYLDRFYHGTIYSLVYLLLEITTTFKYVCDSVLKFPLWQHNIEGTVFYTIKAETSGFKFWLQYLLTDDYLVQII